MQTHWTLHKGQGADRPRDRVPAPARGALDARLGRAEAWKRGTTSEERLLAIFDLFDEWFHREDFEGCSFINVMLETANREHPVGPARDLIEHYR